MKVRRTLILCHFLFVALNMQAQVEIELNPEGIVIPRVHLTDLENPQKGMLVYDLDSNSLRFYTCTNWNTVNESDTNNLAQILSAGNDAADQRITNLGTPINDNDAATKAYVDLQGSGGTVQLGNEMTTRLRLRFEGMVQGDQRGDHSVDLQSQRRYSDEVASGIKSTISGGDSNKASGHGATVSGGKKNASTGLFSSISGGHDNQALGNYSAISGGQLNIAQGEYSFSGSGLNNQSLGRASATLGGQGLRAPFYGQSTLGLFNELTETPADALDEQLFVLGNGTSESVRSNALVVTRRGFMGIGTSLPEANLHLNGSFRLNNGTENDGYFLSTDEDGNAQWTALPVDRDEQSITGSSFENNLLTIGIENGMSQTLDLSSLDNNEDADSDPTNEIELPIGGEAGQLLQTNGSGVYAWVDPTVDRDEQSITGSSFENNLLTIGIENGLSQTLDLSSLDNNEDTDSDPTNEIELPTGGEAGQLLQTNGSGVYQWVDPVEDKDEQSITGSTFENNLLTIGIENGMSQTLDLSSLDNNEDADSDPTNEIELPSGGENGQVLQTNGAGEYSWIDVADNTDNQDLENVLSVNNSAGSQRIRNVGAPVEDNDAVTKAYVDNSSVTLAASSRFVIKPIDQTNPTTELQDDLHFSFDLQEGTYMMRGILQFIGAANELKIGWDFSGSMDQVSICFPVGETLGDGKSNLFTSLDQEGEIPVSLEPKGRAMDGLLLVSEPGVLTFRFARHENDDDQGCTLKAGSWLSFMKMN